MSLWWNCSRKRSPQRHRDRTENHRDESSDRLTVPKDASRGARQSTIRNPQSKMSSAPAGIRTANQQIMLTTSAFAASVEVSGVVVWTFSSLYASAIKSLHLSLFSIGTWLGITIPLSRVEASPNLTDSTSAPETNLTVVRV